MAVREFRSPSYLHQGTIVFKTSPEQIGFYNYHRWAVDPRSAITDAVVNRLAASGDFARVVIYDGRSDVDYILSGKLESLDELDYAGAAAVQVAISAQLTGFQSAKTVWANSVSDTVKVGARTVPAIVAEMIETQKQAQSLLALGVEFGQGYYFGRPGDKLASLPPLRAGGSDGLHCPTGSAAMEDQANDPAIPGLPYWQVAWPCFNIRELKRRLVVPSHIRPDAPRSQPPRPPKDAWSGSRASRHPPDPKFCSKARWLRFFWN